MIFNQKGKFINNISIQPYDDLVMATYMNNLCTFAKFCESSKEL